MKLYRGSLGPNAVTDGRRFPFNSFRRFAAGVATFLMVLPAQSTTQTVGIVIAAAQVRAGMQRSAYLGGNVLEITSRIGQPNLLRGQATWATFTIEGADGIEQDLYLRLRLLTPGIISFLGPSFAIFTPEELSRGRATLRTTIRGIARGNFTIQPELGECRPEHYQQALSGYEEALSEARSSKHREAEAGLLQGAGLAHQRLGRLAEAVSRYGEALEIFRDLGMRAREADTLNRLGGVLLQSRRFEEAIRHFRQCQRLADEMKLPFWSWKSHEGLGDTYAATGQLDRAGLEYRASAQAVEEAGYDFNAPRRGVYEKLVELLGQQNQLEEALHYIQRAKSQALRSGVSGKDVTLSDPALQTLVARSAELEEQRASAQEALRGEHSRPENEQERSLIQTTSQQLASTERELNETLTRIRQQDPSFASLVRVDPALWVDARQLLPPDVALVEYFPAEKSLLIFAITAQSQPVLKQVPVPRVTLEERVARYLREIKARSETEESAKELYRWLIEPVQKEVDSAETLAVMPAGVLFYVPFGSLARAGPDGKLRFLIQDKPIVHLTDLTAWRLMRQNGESAAGGTPLWVAFANPTGDLSAAEDEVNAIAGRYQQKEIYRRNDATKARAQSLRDDCTILHFATHGVLNGDALTRSYLRMANDELLTQGEIYGLGLRKKRTRMVVLSACETAIGARRPGLEFMGLADAFSKAGAASVVGTLWRVADRSSAELLTAFYSGLTDAQKPLSKARALQVAQLQLLRSPEYRRPFYWAPFVLVGEWR